MELVKIINNDHLIKINEDIWSYIFAYCGINEMYKIIQICKYFNKIFQTNKYIGNLSVSDSNELFYMVRSQLFYLTGKNNEEIISSLLLFKKININISYIFHYACLENKYNIVDIILNNYDYDPNIISHINCECNKLIYCNEYGYHDCDECNEKKINSNDRWNKFFLMEKGILNCIFLDYEAINKSILYYLCDASYNNYDYEIYEKHDEMILKFIKYKKINITVSNNYLLRMMIMLDKYKIVKKLIEDNRVMNLINYEEIFLIAFKYHSMLIVKMLLNEKNIDYIYLNKCQNLIYLACYYDTDLTDSENEPIIFSPLMLDDYMEESHDVKIEYRDNIEIVKMLLKNKNTDPCKNDNEVLIMVCEKGKLDLLKILLSDERIDPSIYENYCLKIAIEHNKKDIVDILIKDKRVKNKMYKELKYMLIEFYEGINY